MIPSAGRILRGVSAAIVAATFSACASHGPAQPQFLSSPDQAGVSTDPMAEVNRSVFERNQQFNHAVIYPAAKTYRDTVPEPVRDSISAFTANLNEPVVFANNILQLRFPAATTTFGRFLMNSTIGIGGLVDIASQEGLARQTGDFGQTLYVWGIRDSEFIVVPVVGPSNVRDALGSGVEFGAQIFLGTILPTSAAKVTNYIGTAGTVASPVASLSKFDQVQELEQGSLNFYATMRSVIEQKRQAELREALKQSLLSALAGPEDPGEDDAGALLVSPALSSPALQSPAASSPSLEGPSPVSPPAPVEELKVPRVEAAISGWTLVVEPQPARE